MSSGMQTEQVMVTPELAQSYLNINWDRQRNMREEYVKFLSREMTDDNFNPPPVIDIANVGNNGTVHMYNGQHVSKAIVHSSTTQECTVRTIPVVSEDDVAVLFGRVDVGRQRSLGDSLAAYEMVSKTGLTSSKIKKLAASARFVNEDFGTKKVEKYTIEEQIEMIHNIWLEAGLSYFAVYDSFSIPSSMKSKYLNRAIMSVGITLFKYVEDKELVKDFWTAVISGVVTTGDNHDPRITLRNKLDSIYLNSGKKGMTESPRKQSRYVAFAWNAFAKGESRARLNVHDETSPINLSLTKYYRG